MKKIFSVIIAFMLISTCVYANDGVVTMYAPDGRTTQVYANEVYAYKQVGWYENYTDVITILYAPDGRTAAVYKAEADKYVALGWYTSKTVTMYAPDGRTTQCGIAEISAFKAVGWYEKLSEVLINMYSADGRVIKVYRSEVPAYEAVGWYEKSPAYYRSKPFFTDYGDSFVNDMYIDMTYGEFLAAHSADVTGTSATEYSEGGDDYYFTVYINGAELTFRSSYTNVNDIYSYLLREFESSDSRFEFGRGIKVGKSVSYVKERVPQNNYDSSSHTWYVYDRDGNSYNTIKEIAHTDFLLYYMLEEYGSIHFIFGVPYSGYVPSYMNINLTDGIITSISIGVVMN